MVTPRTPSEPVSAVSVAATWPATPTSARAATVYAGRPFFITIGVTHASWAPASSRAATAWASVSPVASSTLASSSTTGCPAPSASVDVPTTTWVALGRPSISREPAPKPVRLDRHGRQRPEAGRQRGEQGGAGRGGELDTDVEAGGGRAHGGEQRDDRRGGVGQQAVGGPDHAGAGDDGGRPHLVDAEHLEGGAGADDVDDGVEPADLVEVDLLRRATVEAALGVGQRREGGQRAGRHAVGQPGLLDERRDVRRRADDRGVLRVHVQLGGRDPAAQHRLGLDRPAADRQALEQGPHLVEVGAGVDQRSERHVAGDAGEAVEPGEARHVT